MTKDADDLYDEWNVCGCDTNDAPIDERACGRIAAGVGVREQQDDRLGVGPDDHLDDNDDDNAADHDHETFVANIHADIEILDAYVAPGGEPAVFEYGITNPTFFGNSLALMITDQTDDGEWLKVGIPVRPNGTEAWIRTEDADITSHRFSALINLTDRAVTVWDGEEVVVETTAVIGKAATPTPLGSFFVNDFVEKWEGSAYGPQILSLSAFSEAMDTFGGGIPVIAIHGTNRPDLMGGAHSNGCVRVPNEVVRLLAETVPIGTPVDIVA
jgi:hypothetical protein